MKYEGQEITLGDKTFTVPSLSVSQAKTLWPEILSFNEKGITVADFPKKLDAILRTVHAAISRNHPEVTVEELGDLISARNAGDLLQAVALQSGFVEKKKALGEDHAEVVH